MRAVLIGVLLAFCGPSVLAAEKLGEPAIKWPNPVKDPAHVRVILFCPSDVTPPPDFQRGIDRLCDYTDHFIFSGLRQWGLEASAESLFIRKDGHVEVLGVIGRHTAEHYTDPSFHKEAISAASDHYGIPLKHDIWWVLGYVGDPPKRFKAFRGGGSPQFGGWSVANYDSRAPKLRLGDKVSGELGDEMALKGMIHELGHAFGLPHIGPRLKQRPGNTLMGPTNFNYRRVMGKRETHAYLSEASAAMLAAHPIIRQRTIEERKLHKAKVTDLELTTGKGGETFTLSGMLASDDQQVFAILADHREELPGAYWVRHYVSRTQPDGSFQVQVADPDRTGGELRLWFVFKDGSVTGNGRARGVPNSLKRKYSFADEKWSLAPWK